MSNQGARQASVRAITGTEYTYNGDWMALFDQSGIPAGEFNGRFLQWLNGQIPEAKTNLPDAMASYAINVAGVSCWNEVREIGGLPPPTPGPLDFTSDESTDELTVNFDLAAPIAALGVIIAIEGTYTGIEATHGGEPLTLVRDELNVAGQTLTAMFIGNGLTIEESPLVITILGGAVGKAWIGRINDDYGYSNITSAWDDGDTGTSASSKTMTVSGVDGTGKLLSVWGTDTEGRTGFIMPLADYATQFSATVVGGDTTAVTGWTLAARWSEVGGVYTHTGANSGISKILSPTVPGPIGFSADVTLAAGASMTIIMTPTVGTPTQRTIYGPYTGKWYASTEDFLDFQSLAVMASGNTTIENMAYIENPRFLQGVISRSVGNAANGKKATWGSVNVSRFSTTAIEVHQGAASPLRIATTNSNLPCNRFAVNSSRCFVQRTRHILAGEFKSLQVCIPGSWYYTNAGDVDLGNNINYEKIAVEIGSVSIPVYFSGLRTLTTGADDYYLSDKIDPSVISLAAFADETALSLRAQGNVSVSGQFLPIGSPSNTGGDTAAASARMYMYDPAVTNPDPVDGTGYIPRPTGATQRNRACPIFLLGEYA